MNKLLSKLTVTAVTTMVLSGALALSVSTPAQALTFNYSFVTDTGYSGNGQFSYTGNPATVSATGSGPVAPLQSLSLSVFDPANSLLDSGNSVVNGFSSDSYLRFDFNALTETLSILDTNTAASGSNPYYFISNAVDSNGTPITAPGSAFYLFAFSLSGTYTLLGSTSSIQVSSVPEPTSLGLLALGGLAVGYAKRKKQKGEG
ncbi:MAG: PEP-CTERM sorting domain-containing protein [Candidatus Competibacteraceae bacterium]